MRGRYGYCAVGPSPDSGARSHEGSGSALLGMARWRRVGSSEGETERRLIVGLSERNEENEVERELLILDGGGVPVNGVSSLYVVMLEIRDIFD